MAYDVKIAKQTNKGGSRDGDAKNRETPKKATRSPYDNPTKGEDTGRGTPKVIGKLGS